MVFSFPNQLPLTGLPKLGTLGDVRGKLTLIQRFDFNKLPQHLAERMGIHLDPRHWTNNGTSIELTYNAEEGHRAYIQVFPFGRVNAVFIIDKNINLNVYLHSKDHYRLSPPDDSTPQFCIEEKLQISKAHLERAIDTTLHPNQLFISFSSAAFRFGEPSLTPKVR